MCQEFPKEKWIDAQKENVLDAPYYHVVFTVPEELNPIIINIPPPYANCLVNILFSTFLF